MHAVTHTDVDRRANTHPDEHPELQPPATEPPTNDAREEGSSSAIATLTAQLQRGASPFSLSEAHIEAIVRLVPGGAPNVQDLFPLSPLQEGILFHHLLNEQRDPYVLSTLFQLSSQAHLEALVSGLQKVIDRHDILRSVVLWEGLPRPIQVVCRRATLCAEPIALEGGRDPMEQWAAWMKPGHERLSLRQRRLMRLLVAEDRHSGVWYALLQLHHVLCDYQSWNTAVSEAMMIARGDERELPTPTSYREYVEWGWAQANVSDAAAFFRATLGDLEETSAPFGLTDVHGDRTQIEEAEHRMEPALAQRLRTQARRSGVSAARLLHAAWALVVARTSGRDDIAFGTVLLASSRRAARDKRMLGMFVNTLPLRVQLRDVTAHELVVRTDAALSELLRHDEASLTLAQRCSGNGGAAPLFTTLLNYRHRALENTNEEETTQGIRVVARGEAGSNYPIAMIVDDLGDTYTLKAQVDRRLGASRMTQYLFTALQSLLSALEHAPATRALSLSIVPADERQRIQQFNATHVAYPCETLVHEMFEAQCAQAPQGCAVVCEGESLTYAQLNARANQLAHYLREQNVGPEQLVALCVERRVDMIVALLGILKAGAAYLPLDPTYPVERLAYMLKDATPRLLLTHQTLQERLPSTAAKIVTLDDWSTFVHQPTTNLEASALGFRSTQLAYVIYTSGSTGEPKGVMVEHRNLLNLIHWHTRAFDLHAGARCSCVAALGFDAATWEIWPALSAGATVVLASSAVASDPEKLIHWWMSQALDVSFLATPLAEQVFSDARSTTRSLRTLLIGGDQLRQRPGGLPFAVINNYGPTEATVLATSGRIHTDDPVLHIGQPIANTQVHLLDDNMQPVPIGVAAQVYIGGASVARGYLNRAALTAQRFIVDPFSRDPQARLYATGDLARWRSDGTLEYLGRNDDQIKIRGYRIELGEIETQLARHAEVKEAVVVVREESPRLKRLIAYVKLQARSELNVQSLRAHLEKSLPEYMVPSAFVTVEAWPLTANGKLDRRALPVPGAADYATQAYEPPLGQVEPLIAGIWAQLLEVSRVGRRDSFFLLGGHSLLAMQMTARVQELLGVQMPIRAVFEAAMLSDFSARAEQLLKPDPSDARVEGEPRSALMTPILLQPRNRAGGIVRLPAAGAQQRLWFIDQLEGGHGAYHVPLSLRLRGELQIEALESALNAMIARHEVLRTSFIKVDGELLQEIAVTASMSLRLFDLSLLDAHEREQQVKRHTHEELVAPFDLGMGPLMRGRILQLAHDEYVLLLTLHHIISDGWSVGVLIRELGLLYEAYCEGHADPLPALPIQYADYVQWHRQWLADAQLQQQVRFWISHLQGAPELLHLPTDRPRPATRTYQGATAPVALGHELSTALKTLCLKLNVTLTMLLHAAWTLVLSRLSGQDDIVIGLPVANRPRSELEGLIGLFINTLAVRIRVENEARVEDLLLQVKEVMLAAYANQDAPFERVVEQLQPGRSLSYSPVFQVMFAMQNAPSGTMRSRLTLVEQELSLETAKFDLTLSLQEGEAGITGTLNYATDVFELHTIQRWITYFIQALRGMAADPEQSVSRLDLMDRQEHRRIASFSETHVAYPAVELIHERFEQRVARQPEAIAVVCADQTLTFAQLNTRANRLARRLQQEGVGPDQPVALHLERSPEMIIGLFAILKAGGAYVPLDADAPSARLLQTMEDAGARIVLTQNSLRELWLGCSAKVMAIDAEDATLCAATVENLDPQSFGLKSHHLAYVIYTSGSTGAPKGVMVTHKNVMSLWQGLEHIYAQSAPCERVAVNASITFDASVKQLIQLLSGRTLVLVPQAIRADAGRMLAFLDTHRVNAIDCTPGQLSAWVLAGLLNRAGDHRLQVVLIGGEPIDPKLWTQLANATDIDFYNVYGPTESTVDTTVARLNGEAGTPHIGRPMQNRYVYILDRHQRAVPIGVPGELTIGGAGVARGYLNRPELTRERFLPDPFSTDWQARMYRSGDLARWRFDGTIEYLGRNDHQVKIRGFRIELGEIEAKLLQDAQVGAAAVIAREDSPGDKRLVAYVVPSAASVTISLESLRDRLRAILPQYMIPSAFVVLARLPHTANGKLDRRALPIPDLSTYTCRDYEAPQGEVETLLAGLWQTLLNVERVGRHDNFFELGGHSLLIMQMLERVRRVGLSVEVRRIFESPTLAALASALVPSVSSVSEIPPNLIPPQCEAITPSMLPLVELEASHLALIAQAVPGGAPNIQDIYPLAPLQEGILFHYLLNERGADTYVVPILLSLSSRERVSQLIAALQSVIDRHDVLRTAVLWEQLPQAVQVVYRHAPLVVEERVLDAHADLEPQLARWLKPQNQRMDPRRAPLMRLEIAQGQAGQWFALLQTHHLTSDHVTLEMVTAEVVAHLEGRAHNLAEPGSYRTHVAHALAYARTHDAEAFFRHKLGDVDEPTVLFGLADVHEDVSDIEQARKALEPTLASAIRAQARRLGVSAATLFHAAWALVVACTSGRDDVVFGSVLLGRLQGSAGAQGVMGMFINTLPLRLQLRDLTVSALVEHTQRELIELLTHEQASLGVAQQCSALPGSAPLFTSLFNFRHSAASPEALWSQAKGVRMLGGQDWTNYPITVSVDDEGVGFAITAQTDRRVDPCRVSGYLLTAIESVIHMLDQAPHTPALRVSIVPKHEREQLVLGFNATHGLESRVSIHELFEQQVVRTPEALAVVHGVKSFTYAQLNAQAERLARQLTRAGVAPGKLVGICLERSPEMLVGVLAILKAGAAYVPLDPNYPTDRLQYMLEDAAPPVVLTQPSLRAALPPTAAELIDLHLGKEDDIDAEDFSPLTPPKASLSDPVYVIYTSGSTGRPKGVVMPHAAMANLLEWHRLSLPLARGQRVLQFAALSFDVAFQEIFSTLTTGATLVLLDEWVRRDAQALLDLLQRQSVERLFLPPLMLQSLAECAAASSELPQTLCEIITAGEQLRITPEIVHLFKRLARGRLHNHYGPTETHVVTALTLPADPEDWPVLPSIGAPIANTQIYILDRDQQPAPIGVTGEIYIGGANVALGYRNQPDLSRQRFSSDPFSSESAARLYRTGDVGRWHADGTIEYLGRNDDQVKIRGYRIELREIEARLAWHEGVRETAVIVREDAPGEKRLVAYVVPRERAHLEVNVLREHVRAALPDFMVPQSFVLLEHLPTTPSGKLNRRELPAPELAEQVSEGELPRGPVESALAQIWQALLRVHRVGRADNFFAIGGHSLLVLKMLFKVNEALGSTLRVADVYRSPTLQELASRIAGVEAQDEPVDLSREAVLDAAIVPTAVGASTGPSAILFTGATGFVGRYLLIELLRTTDAIIHCLVRAPDRHQAWARLKESLATWDLWREEFASRLRAVPGDLRLPQLGLDERTYRHLASNVHSIYHCATSMNHLETYAMAKAANVDAVQELLRLATTQQTKLVNFVSSLGVFGPAATGMTRVVSEATSIDHEQHWNSRGYVASKWVGEKLILLADERGIPCNVFRVGLVWADSELGRYDELQRGYRILKSSLLSGYGIENYRFEMPAAPVDYTAQSIITLARRYSRGGGVFHLCGAGQMLDRVFERCNEIAGAGLRLLPFYEWVLRMKQLHELGTSLPVVPLIAYAFSMDEASFYQRQRLIRTALRFDDERTRSLLAQDGIVVPPLTDELLRMTLTSMLRRDPDLRTNDRTVLLERAMRGPLRA